MVADHGRCLQQVQKVKSRLLAEPVPAVAKITDELKAAHPLPNPPKPRAVDFDLLELLLPGYRLKTSKDFIAPAGANVPMYEPLPGPDSFRLLVIEPWGADKHQLRCHLRAVRLEDAKGRYNALSYCWSQPVRGTVQSMICNGVKVDAGENLRLALESIRYRTLPRIVWVDALCINQADLAERNQQVQLMGKIYQQAIETVVWLGDVFSHGPTVPELDAICNVVKSWDTSLTPYYEARDKKGKLCRYESRGSNSWTFQAVSNLFACPWFERRWVLQEVALARSAVVKIPGVTIQWKWIGLAAGIIRTNHDSFIRRYNMPNLYNAYLMFRLSKQGPLPPLDISLLSLLRLTTGFKATEKLDVVFALLGLFNRREDGCGSCSASEAFKLKVDYNLSESELGMLVAKCHMAQPRRPLSFLSDAIGVANKPSWSPRWIHKRLSMLEPWTLNDDSDAFNPAKELFFKRFPSTDPNHLKVEGVQLSQVSCRTATFSTYQGFDSIMADLVRILLTYHRGFDIWNAPAISAVAMALCGERDKYGGRAKNKSLIIRQFSAFVRTWLWCHAEEFPTLVKTLGSESVYQESDGTTWVDAAERVCLGRCLFYTTSGHIGLGPGDMNLGDTVCILGGAGMPIVVRPLADHFGIVGDCYLNGVMDGEATDAMAKRITLSGPLLIEGTHREIQSRYEPLRLRQMSFC